MKARILETADRLFYLQGIRAVGVDTIAAEAGISKRTLYNHFPSKDALIVAYLERRNAKTPPPDREPNRPPLLPLLPMAMNAPVGCQCEITDRHNTAEGKWS